MELGHQENLLPILFFGIWDDIPCIPNKKEGGFCFGGKIAPIFFNTLEDSGAFPIEMDVTSMTMGQEVILEPFNGRVLDAKTNEVISDLNLKLM